MTLMNLKEWSQLTIEAKRHWLITQTTNDLENILIIVHELLEHVDDSSAELAMLPQNDALDAVRILTNEGLRDMEISISETLKAAM